MIFNRVQEGDVADLILFWRPFGSINLQKKRAFWGKLPLETL